MPDLPRPPFDPELAEVLEFMVRGTISPEDIEAARAPGAIPLAESWTEGRPVTIEDRTVTGYDGGEITVSVLRRTDHADGGPAVCWIHGGGMISGSRLQGLDAIVDWVERYDAVAVTVDYRLAPEHPDPVPVEDCYAALVWFAGQAEELGFDPERLMIAGGSAGGGLAAGVALLARDRRGPAIAAQLLLCPMLDDRDATVSTRQMDGAGNWDRGSNRSGWGALLGDRYGTDDVSPYAAPARAKDLSDLPPTFLDVGSAEVFRDEIVAYASAIWAAGGDCELHVWPGGFHGFDGVVPGAAVSRAARAAREAWVQRRLA